MEARPPTAATIRAPPPLPPEKRHKDAPDISHTVGRQFKQPHTQHTSTTKATAVRSRSARRSSTFVFSASKADRSRPMHIIASETDFDAVSDAHRRFDPGHRSDAR